MELNADADEATGYFPGANRWACADLASAAPPGRHTSGIIQPPVHAVAMRAAPLKNLRLAVERCHLGIARQLYAPYAAGLSTLAPDEMALGATLIDLGAGSTSVAVFMENALVHVESVPIGGFHITSDIARVLSAPLGAAERIKTLSGGRLDIAVHAAGEVVPDHVGDQVQRGPAAPLGLPLAQVQPADDDQRVALAHGRCDVLRQVAPAGHRVPGDLAVDPAAGLLVELALAGC